MSKVTSFLKEIRNALKPIETEIFEHPYIQALEQGSIAKEKLAVFAGEQYNIVSSDLRSISHLLARSSTSISRDFFWFIIQGELTALENLYIFAESLGMNEQQLEDYQPMAAAQAYKNCMAWLGLQGRPSEVAAAFLVNFPAWGQNCGRMSKALQNRYGLPKKAVAFFDAFATPSEQFAKKAEAVIDKGLSAGDDPHKIRIAVQHLQEYELMFWDAVYDDAVGR